jgi:hypothetical protein
MRTLIAIIALTAAVSAQALRDVPTVKDKADYIAANSKVTLGSVNFKALIVPATIKGERVQIVSDGVVTQIVAAEKEKTALQVMTENKIEAVSIYTGIVKIK